MSNRGSVRTRTGGRHRGGKYPVGRYRRMPPRRRAVVGGAVGSMQLMRVDRAAEEIVLTGRNTSILLKVFGSRVEGMGDEIEIFTVKPPNRYAEIRHVILDYDSQTVIVEDVYKNPIHTFYDVPLRGGADDVSLIGLV